MITINMIEQWPQLNSTLGLKQQNITPIGYEIVFYHIGVVPWVSKSVQICDSLISILASVILPFTDKTLSIYLEFLSIYISLNMYLTDLYLLQVTD